MGGLDRRSRPPYRLSSVASVPAIDLGCVRGAVSASNRSEAARGWIYRCARARDGVVWKVSGAGVGKEAEGGHGSDVRCARSIDSFWPFGLPAVRGVVWI